MQREIVLRKRDILSVIRESDARAKRMFGKRNQLTGEGIDLHTNKYMVVDYPIRTQFLTDAVFRNKLYKDVAKSGSVTKYTNQFNANLESLGVADKITTDDVVKEMMLVRLANDPSFAFFVCFRIKYKQGGTGPFILNYAQHFVLSELEKMRLAEEPIRIVLLKARQWGGSTLVQLYMAWVQLFVREQWYSAIVAQTKDTAKRIKAMYKKVLDSIPGLVFGTDCVIFSPYEKSSADSIITKKDGTILRDNVITTASYENFESTRGQDYAMAHFSEVAYWRTTGCKSAEDVITNIESNILEAPLTMLIEESTARGMSGHFFNAYQLAKSGKSNRKAIFIPFFYIENDRIFFDSSEERQSFVRWLLENKDDEVAPDKAHESPAYIYSLWEKGATLEHLKWYIKKRESFTDHAQMASEAPSDDVECFKFSGVHVFSIKVVDDLRERYVREPIFRGDIVESNGGDIKLEPQSNGLLQVWQMPDEKKCSDRYITVVDVGGRNPLADYSVITVLDRWSTRLKDGKLEVVARWRGHIRYDYLAYKAVKMSRYWGNALLVIESNTFDKKKAQADEYVDEGDHILGILKKLEGIYDNLYMRPATNEEDIRQGILNKVGFHTNVKTKQEMVDNFVSAFEDDRFIDPDERFYQEAAIYVIEDGKYQNIQGKDNHDDILMTNMIGALVHTKMPTPRKERETDNSFSPGQGTFNESQL